MTHCCRGYYDILILSTKDISKKFKGDKIIMEYEIVNLPEKTAVGISARTNNFSLYISPTINLILFVPMSKLVIICFILHSISF